MCSFGVFVFPVVGGFLRLHAVASRLTSHRRSWLARDLKLVSRLQSKLAFECTTPPLRPTSCEEGVERAKR